MRVSANSPHYGNIAIMIFNADSATRLIGQLFQLMFGLIKYMTKSTSEASDKQAPIYLLSINGI